MGVTHIFDVQVRIDGDSKVYQHYLAQKGDSCGVAIEKALSDALYGLLEARIPEVADNLPAADVVEVVRCKDCKYIRPEVDAYTHEAVGCWCSLLDLGSVEDEHFCSYGKRRVDPCTE